MQTVYWLLAILVMIVLLINATMQIVFSITDRRYWKKMHKELEEEMKNVREM